MERHNFVPAPRRKQHAGTSPPPRHSTNVAQSGKIDINMKGPPKIYVVFTEKKKVTKTGYCLALKKILRQRAFGFLVPRDPPAVIARSVGAGVPPLHVVCCPLT